MGTKVRKRRTTADLSKLSTQTRLTAWTVYMESIRDGMDPDVAIRKALQDACPPKDDPYYRSFYPNKMRELELWRKHGLWPLSKPKDIEHDTGPYDTVEVANDVRNRAIQNEPGSSSFTLLLDPDDQDDNNCIDTLEFDPVEVAKIIDSYEHTPTLSVTGTIETAEASMPRGMKNEFAQVPLTDRPPCSEIVTKNPYDFSCLPESDKIVHDPSPCCQSVFSVSQTPPLGGTQALGQNGHTRVELDQGSLSELLAMLAWWKDNKERLSRPESPLALRPHFTHGKLKTKRIRMNERLWEDAQKVAKQQTEISGGTLSGLLEYLVWRHLGSQEKHVKK